MTANLTVARQNLRQVSTFLRQGMCAAGVQAVHSALQVMRTESLIQSERKEISALISEAVAALNAEPTIYKLFPLSLVYTPGKEHELATNIAEMQACFAEHAKDQAEEAQKAKGERKRALFERGKSELATAPGKGRATLVNLAREHPLDAELLSNIGEAFLAAKLFEDAVPFLTQALDLKEDMLSVYNSIGMALRELKQYELAETYYLRASKYLPEDRNLFFNIARLYVDWKKWDKARQAAQVALKNDDSFVPAQKLLAYVDKMEAQTRKKL